MQPDEHEHYRNSLLRLRKRLTDEAQAALDEVVHNAAPDGDSRMPTHLADRASEGLDRSVAIEASREQTLEAIDLALARVNEGKYGVCMDCGREITKVRLDALPFAVRCVACEEARERVLGT